MTDKPIHEDVSIKIKRLLVENDRLKSTIASYQSDLFTLNSLVDALSRAEIGIDIIDVNYHVHFQNQFLEARFGPLNHQFCYEKYMGLDTPCAFCPMEKAIKANQVEKIELAGADGKYYEILSVPLQQEEGTIGRALEIVKDITESKKTYQALSESEENYRRLFNAGGDGILIADITTTGFIESNPAACKLLGYTRHELLTKTVRDIHPPDALDHVLQEFNAQAAGKKRVACDIPCLTKQGTVVYADISTARATIKERECNIGFFRDITERKLAEKQLQENRERLALVLEGGNIGYWDWNLETGEVKRNEQWARMLGYTLSEIEYNVKQWTDLHHPDDREAAWESIQDHLQGRTQIHKMEYRMLAKDGQYKWILDCAKIVKRDAQGRPLRMSGTHTDVTESRLIRERLLESEAKFRTLAERCPFAIMIYQDDYWVYVNPAVEAISGFVPEEFYNMRFWEVVHPDHRKLVLESGKKRQSGQPAPQSYDLKIIHKEGREVWVSLSGSSLTYEGKPAGMVTITDITERKKAEAALRESEEKYRNILENMEDGYFEVDIAGNFTFYNNAMCHILGYEENQLTGLNNRRYMDAKNAQTVYRTFNHVYKTGESVKALDWELIRKDSGRCSVETSVSLLKDAQGRPIGFKGITRDITERKKNISALQESEARYRLLAENMTDNLWTFDLGAMRYSYLSPAVQGIIGFTPEEAITLTLEEIMTPSSYEFVSKLLVEEMFEASRHYDPSRSRTFEVELRHKDGSTVWTEASVRFVYDDKQQPVALQGITRDISERKRLQNQLQKSQKMESLGLLASGVAHDLNNVLSGIVSYPELLLMNLPEDSNLRKPLKTIMESGNRAAAIVQDLLTIARGVAITREPLKLNELVSDYFHSPEFEKLNQFYPNVSFRTHLSDDLFNIEGSDVHIRKALMNLIANAAEAVNQSGQVAVSTGNRLLEKPLNGYETIDIGEYAVLSVADDGPGISSNDLRKIFEPFYTKKKMGRSGTGLGLSVVWNIMKDHKGYIDVTSHGPGTLFDLYFPITWDTVFKTDRNVSLTNYKGRGERILVVDDVESQREITSRMLDMLGYVHTAVSGGEAAVDYLKHHRVDLVLLDMIMEPGISGYETYKQIINLHPRQKALLLSGFSETDDVRKTQALGAGKYLKKPIMLEKLGMAIKEELKK